MQANSSNRPNRMTIAVLVLVLLSSGRAMTLWWIGRAGDGGPDDPPAAWLMPLIGDAAVGLTAMLVAALLWRRRNPQTWAIAIAWSAVAAFDALAAYLVEIQSPWPEFFMLELFGRSMFFVAAAMHLVIVGLLFTAPVKADLGVHRHRPQLDDH